MKICVYGLWHLGSVTAACLSRYFTVQGFDPDPETLSKLSTGRPPLYEPGLERLIQTGLAQGSLTFTNSLAAAVKGADLVWVTFDTPVNDDDAADVDSVFQQIEALFPFLTNGMTVLLSSQLPVGFTARLEKEYRLRYPQQEVHFSYSPENLRLGKAIDVFSCPERVVVGIRRETDKALLTQLFQPFCGRIEWMSVESAEMTKHALNAFLATSVTFINEVAALCEEVGADAKEVERGLKSDLRIGAKAYLGPGGAFAGGTLARDVTFLTDAAQRVNVPAPLLAAVHRSNDAHKDWPRRALQHLFGTLAGKRVAILGLTYKPGTDTLRRSSAVELCLWLADQGAVVQAFDPAVNQLPPLLAPVIRFSSTCEKALQGADALVIATEWPMFKALSSDDLIKSMRTPIVIDPNRFLAAALATDRRLQYVAVGQPRRVG